MFKNNSIGYGIIGIHSIIYINDDNNTVLAEFLIIIYQFY